MLSHVYMHTSTPTHLLPLSHSRSSTGWGIDFNLIKKIMDDLGLCYSIQPYPRNWTVNQLVDEVSNVNTPTDMGISAASITGPRLSVSG